MTDDQKDYIRRIFQKEWYTVGHKLAKQLAAGKITSQDAAIETKMKRNILYKACDELEIRLWPRDYDY